MSGEPFEHDPDCDPGTRHGECCHNMDSCGQPHGAPLDESFAVGDYVTIYLARCLYKADTPDNRRYFRGRIEKQDPTPDLDGARRWHVRETEGDGLAWVVREKTMDRRLLGAFT